jgi:uncharacterized protein YhhL (DUF1145 family)
MSLSPDKKREIALMLIHMDIELYRILAVDIRVPNPEQYMDRVRVYIFAIFHVLGLEKELSDMTGIPINIVSSTASKAYEIVRRGLFEK